MQRVAQELERCTRAQSDGFVAEQRGNSHRRAIAQRASPSARFERLGGRLDWTRLDWTRLPRLRHDKLIGEESAALILSASAARAELIKVAETALAEVHRLSLDDEKAWKLVNANSSLPNRYSGTLRLWQG